VDLSELFLSDAILKLGASPVDCPEVSIWEIREPDTTQFNGRLFRICHENVTQSAENCGKNAVNDNKWRRKWFARICSNLLNPFD
jgi:hypothetical protein